MRISISKVCVGLAFLCMVPATGFTEEKSYLCAINEVYECVAVTGAQPHRVENLVADALKPSPPTLQITLTRPLRRRSLFGRLPGEVLFVCLCVRFGGVDYPVAMVRRSIKRVAGGADFIRIKFFWLLSPELRWLGQPAVQRSCAIFAIPTLAGLHHQYVRI